MKASIVQIGNSQGLRIPQVILKQCGFDREVELEVRGQELIVKSPSHAREGWEEAFKAMAHDDEDKFIEFVPNQWDEEEWEWK